MSELSDSVRTDTDVDDPAVDPGKVGIGNEIDAVGFEDCDVYGMDFSSDVRVVVIGVCFLCIWVVLCCCLLRGLMVWLVLVFVWGVDVSSLSIGWLWYLLVR